MATYNSSSVNRLGYPRGAGVYPVKDMGVIQFVTANSLAVADVINICYIPPNSVLTNFYATIPILDNGGSPTMNMGLIDNLASATTYIATSTNKGTHYSVATNFSLADFTGTTIGTQYGATLRALGTSGNQVAVWASGALLQFKLGTVAANTVGATVYIQYVVEWSPAYDQGV